MAIEEFDHYTVRTADIEASQRFYEQGLGLRCEPRPGATVPAILVFVGDQAMVHIFQASPEMEAIFARQRPRDEESAAWMTGRMHHIALRARGLDDMRARLQSLGVGFTERSLAAQEKHLIVLKDPDGIELELQFPLSEAGKEQQRTED